jgi:hypothetical protein
MSDDFSRESTPQVEPQISPEGLAQLYAASGVPSPAPPDPPPSRWSLRSKLLGAILFAGIGVGASAMSCVGQSFSLRQARALEGIEQQLIQIRASCIAAPSGMNGR